VRIEDLPGGGLLARAPAKLNLYLEVGETRADGFHEIDSLLQSISLCDELEFFLRRDRAITLAEEGLSEGEENLVYRAARVLREACLAAGSPFGATIRLRKRIPTGAGLGGGSSDAAATLVALSKLWGLRVSLEELKAIGARLGADVAFFFHCGTSRCRGRGEHVAAYGDVFDAAEPFHYVLVYPGIHVSTGQVYEALDSARKAGDAGFALTAPSPLDSMSPTSVLEKLAAGELLFNRLEGVTCRLHPELHAVAALMKKEPFLKVLMTGSGSTFFGLSRNAEEVSRIAGNLRKHLDNPLQQRGDDSYRPPSGDEHMGVKVFEVKSQPGCRFSWLE
jgi:4-diphosphocytidyl-2-C-methyl-D-erythritol kinase